MEITPSGSLNYLFVTGLCFAFLFGFELFLDFGGLRGGGVLPWVMGVLAVLGFGGTSVLTRNSLKQELTSKDEG